MKKTIKFLAIIAVMIMAVSCSGAEKQCDNTACQQKEEKKEENMKVMQQFVDFINTGDTNIGEQIISPDVIFYAPTSPEPMHGLEGYVAVLDVMRGAMPDVKWNAEEYICEGNKVMVRFTMQGTQSEPFMGMPATGRPVNVTAMNIYQIEDGKIVREHGLPDLFSMLMQLGAIPAPGAPQE